MRVGLMLGAALGAVLATGAWSGSAAAQSAPVDSTPYIRARDMVSNGEVEQGRHAIDSLLAASTPGTPAYAEGLYWRAAVAQNARDAERDYRQVVVDYPLSTRVPDALLRLGQLEAARGDRDAALQHFQRVVIEYPDSPRRAEASYWVANTYLLRNDLQRGCTANADAEARVASTNVELKNRIDFQQQRCRNVQLAGGATPAATSAPAASAPTKSATREVPVTQSRVTADTQRVASESTSVARATDTVSAAPVESATVAKETSKPSAKRGVSVTKEATKRETKVATKVTTRSAAASTSASKSKVVKTAQEAAAVKARSAAESTAATAPASASSTRGYAVQVAAYTSRTQADSLAAKLRARGYPSHVDGDTTPYRVRIGHYHTRADAVAVLRQLKAKKIDGFVAEF